MKLLKRSLLLAGTALAAVTSASHATAQDAVSELIVTGAAERQLLLDVKTATGSRLGLTARETPAIVDILSERQMQPRTSVAYFSSHLQSFSWFRIRCWSVRISD